jgi:hypothetical protein
MSLKMKTLLAAMLLAAGGATTVHAQATLPTGPLYGDQDLSPFYRWQEALPQKPGVVLREEAAPANPEIVLAAKASRILYTSTDV